MALTGSFRIGHDEAFPMGAFVVGEVEPIRDFDKSTRERFVQQLDRETGLPLWSVTVLDADPAARKSDKTLTVKIAAPHQPVPPETGPGMPFRPVFFDGLEVRPYVVDNGGGRPRIGYSLRAASMRAPGGKPSPRSSSEAA
ncbi:plasmid replication, integration and excision activator [Pseudonocardia bannensis]|uniref:Plasmid replication, integration and excision activator n=1 Tax=Pseudonocardia bannensis TaxID=630973 RepID=A0A848DLA7_9PSEU|nr:plasmid replication, integration and excision activator [Pseudonocardia bannensis]NMH93184.1 plasmid replication, integration and excision activator [Pseudonocardia bannensis]